MTVVNFPKFSGSSKEDPQEWLNKWQTITEVNGQNDACKFAVMKTCFRKSTKI